MDRIVLRRAHSSGLRAAEGLLVGRQRLESLSQFTRALHGKSGAHFARITEFAAFAVGEIQRSDRPSAAARVAEAGNDELLPPRALDLQPGPLPARAIWGIGLLGDDALQAGLAGPR